nr:MAG TPA: hypothetical protein [Caudoviricetes sp.]
MFLHRKDTTWPPNAPTSQQKHTGKQTERQKPFACGDD